MIYVACITYSVLGEDGKKRLHHNVQAFPTETMAVQYIDSKFLAWTGDERKYRCGTVHTIEEVSE